MEEGCPGTVRVGWDMWGSHWLCDGCGFAAEDDDQVILVLGELLRLARSQPVEAWGFVR